MRDWLLILLSMYIETPPPTLFLSLRLNTCEYPKKLCVDTLYSQSHVSVKDKNCYVTQQDNV